MWTTTTRMKMWSPNSLKLQPKRSQVLLQKISQLQVHLRQKTKFPPNQLFMLSNPQSQNLNPLLQHKNSNVKVLSSFASTLSLPHLQPLAQLILNRPSALAVRVVATLTAG